MNEIKRGRFNSYLVRLLGMQVAAPATELAPFVHAGINIEDYSEDHWFAQGWWICGGSVGPGAVAAKNNVVLLRNPATSGIIAVIDECTVSSSAAGFDIFSAGVVYGAADLAQLPAAGDCTATLDTRYGSAIKKPSCSLTYDNSPPLGVNANREEFYVLQYTRQVMNPGVVLGPNGCFQIHNSVLNVTNLVTIKWRERPVTDLELGQG